MWAFLILWQSYCLKVKEMDDEEYSCIVSIEVLVFQMLST